LEGRGKIGALYQIGARDPKYPVTPLHFTQLQPLFRINTEKKCQRIGETTTRIYT